MLVILRPDNLSKPMLANIPVFRVINFVCWLLAQSVIVSLRKVALPRFHVLGNPDGVQQID